MDYQRIWGEETIEWRLSNPELPNEIKNDSVSSPTGKFDIQAILKSFDKEYSIDDNQNSLGFKRV